MEAPLWSKAGHKLVGAFGRPGIWEEPPDVLRSTPPVYLLFHPLILAIVSIWLLTGFLVMLCVFLPSSTILKLSTGFLLPDAT
ncbi:Metabotropic Glutamate Receptor 5 [Manis pentadactyla]|nr:Metabotropic Glutamate Receptor 5 [Manis pentadactyla]